MNQQTTLARPLVTLSFASASDAGTALIETFTDASDSARISSFRLTLTSAWGVFGSTWTDIGTRSVVDCLAQADQNEIIDKLLPPVRFDAQRFFDAVQTQLRSSPYVAALSEGMREFVFEELSVVRHQHYAKPEDALFAVRDAEDYPALADAVFHAGTDLWELSTGCQALRAQADSFMASCWSAFVDELRSHRHLFERPTPPRPGPLTDDQIRDFARRAGFRVWRDGSMTAADVLDGVPHAGAALTSVTALVRLLENHLGSS